LAACGRSGGHFAETNLRCAGISRICMPKLNIVAYICSFRDDSVHTDRRTWLDRLS